MRQLGREGNEKKTAQRHKRYTSRPDQKMTRVRTLMIRETCKDIVPTYKSHMYLFLSMHIFVLFPLALRGTN